MGRAPCCDKANVKRGPWSPEEDAKLKDFIHKYGTGGNWIALPQKAGLKRCGKSCRLRWLNYLRPNIKHGDFSDEEDRVICSLYSTIGSRWSIIAAQLPGRTDNDIKNYWNTKLKKKLMGLIPSSNQRQSPYIFPPTNFLHATQGQPNNLYTPNRPFITDLDQSNLLYTNNNTINFPLGATNHQYSYNFQSQQEDNLMNPMQCYPQLKDNLLMFGGTTEASCSSSDGSQLSFGHKEIKKEDIIMGNFTHGQNISSVAFEENQNFMTWVDQKQNGYFGNNYQLVDQVLLQYDLDQEVKQQQLTSCANGNNGSITTSGCNNNNSMFYY